MLRYLRSLKRILTLEFSNKAQETQYIEMQYINAMKYHYLNLAISSIMELGMIVTSYEGY